MEGPERLKAAHRIAARVSDSDSAEQTPWAIERAVILLGNRRRGLSIDLR